MSHARSGVLVVGIGNQDCGDDAFGPAVASRLRGRVPSEVCVLQRSGDCLGVIEEWDGYHVVVVIDAAAPVSQPGRVHPLDLTDRALPVGPGDWRGRESEYRLPANEVSNVRRAASLAGVYAGGSYTTRWDTT
jgi:hypothetical protein